MTDSKPFAGYIGVDPASPDGDMTCITMDNSSYEKLKAKADMCDALMAQVVVLEDGAEPQESDVIRYDGRNTRNRANYITQVMTDHLPGRTLIKFNATGAKYRIDSLRNLKIIQRNNKPVIYQSALNRYSELEGGVNDI